MLPAIFSALIYFVLQMKVSNYLFCRTIRKRKLLNLMVQSFAAARKHYEYSHLLLFHLHKNAACNISA
jgi:hypothetical protein